MSHIIIVVLYYNIFEKHLMYRLEEVSNLVLYSVRSVSIRIN